MTSDVSVHKPWLDRVQLPVQIVFRFPNYKMACGRIWLCSAPSLVWRTLIRPWLSHSLLMELPPHATFINVVRLGAEELLASNDNLWCRLWS